MGHTVQHFFANGGSQAIVVRVLGAGALAAAATLKETLPAGNGRRSTLTANGKGEWANWNGSVGVDVAADRAGTANPDDLFNLVVTYWTLDPQSNPPVEGAQESYLNLSMSPKHPRYALNVVAASQLVVPSLPAAPHLHRQGHVGRGSAVDQPAHDQGQRRRRCGSRSTSARPSTSSSSPPTRPTSRKTPAQIVTELTAALSNAGLAATASQSSGTLTITSDNAGMDSAVIVTPAPSATSART